ncbi:SusC/RagA family TonB-linked outer membrane protein [Pedobacter faecalis]|uniref:SusC/RagA family TonB-linked outer membrane protein n=1 Tax=Pedobacter faecalis TaxID=3041495 RepID=UPI002549C627|nr:SusC/RagA family TonB-linked outer membrane protein [Pedobacter sp. ELA7]
MRLTTVLLIASLLQVSAATLGQKITLDQKNVPLKSLFKEIRKQSGYNFFYDGKVVTPGIKSSVQVSNATIDQAMANILADLPLKYEIRDRTILITRNERTALFSSSPEFRFIEVRGKILDENGTPLPGATILIKGTGKTTKSDDKGEFSFSGVDDNVVLVISYIGYASKEVLVKDAVMPLEIRLDMVTGKLQEVGVSVNTGYQSIAPEQSTGAAAVITTRDYESRVSSNFLDGLVNRLPGLMINNDVSFTSTINNTSSSRALFNIRGISTMTGNPNPLIVVDGYPTELSLNIIDPNEIKSVTVLKDAAAATIYGVRASNGVIVIERKQADPGKPQITFRATAGITPKEDYSRYRWAEDASSISVDYQRFRYGSGVSATTWNNLPTFAGSQAFDPTYYVLAQQAAGVITAADAEAKFAEMKSYNNAEDYSRLFLRTAATQTYNVNMSGGSERATYYITANYIDNALQQQRSGNNRFMLAGRTMLNFSKRFSLELNTEYQEDRSRAGVTPNINSINPYERFQDENGNPAAIFLNSGMNPYYSRTVMNLGLEDHLYYPLVDRNEVTDQRHTANNRTTANFNYKLGKGFNMAFGGIYETSRTGIRHFATGLSSEARQFINSYATQTGTGITYTIPKGGFLQQQTASTTGYTARAQLNYNKRLGSDHSLNGIVGGELRKITDQGGSAAYFGYNDESLIQQSVNWSNITNNTVQKNVTRHRTLDYNSLFNQKYVDNRYLSAYSNIVYSFKDTYSLSGSIRIDQSNLFGTDPRYKYKPLWSVGAAWNLHKEGFMESLTWLKQLKLRVADGFNGNIAKMSLPQVIAKAATNTYTQPNSVALQVASYANSSLRWEQTHSTNLGLDYQIFSGISGSFDYYRKKSTDLLASAFIDPTIGTSPTLINSGSIRNQGLEINLRGDWIAKPRFNWNTGLVLSHNTSKVLDVYQTQAYYPDVVNKFGYRKGYPVGALFAYRSAGLDPAGYPQVKDGNGNIYAVTNTTTGLGYVTLESAGTVRYVGSSVPTVNAGLSNRVDIGNFYVYCMLSYYGGFKVFKPRENPTAIRPLEGSSTYWKQAGDEQNTEVMLLSGFSGTGPGWAYNYADSHVVNGDYFTLADLTVSYSVRNTNLLKRVGLSHLELKAQGSNLWTVGLNKYNYSMATGSYAKSYLTPTYTFGLFTNF